MIKKLWPYTKGYRLWIVLGIACSACEAVFELLLPLVMADIVDVGGRGLLLRLTGSQQQCQKAKGNSDQLFHPAPPFLIGSR